MVLRPDASHDLNDMLAALAEDVDYVERDVRLHAFPVENTVFGAHDVIANAAAFSSATTTTPAVAVAASTVGPAPSLTPAFLEPGLWGLDRVGQRALPLDGAYVPRPGNDGAGVHVVRIGPFPNPGTVYSPSLTTLVIKRKYTTYIASALFYRSW